MPTCQPQFIYTVVDGATSYEYKLKDSKMGHNRSRTLLENHFFNDTLSFIVGECWHEILNLPNTLTYQLAPKQAAISNRRPWSQKLTL